MSMRDQQIDLMRFLGLSLIILAHVEPPAWLLQLRNFDVPLIVLVSGMAMAQTSFNETYTSYLWKRIKRLAFPTWLFLTMYFVFIRITGIELARLTFENVWGSYALLDGIGYVWIIRVFLLVALAAPLILILDQRIKSNRIYLGILLGAYLLYEACLLLIDSFAAGIWENLLTDFFCYAMAYAIIFAIGLRIKRLTSKEIAGIGAGSFLVFVILGIAYYLSSGRIVPTQEYKYPPAAYYLSYAMSASILIWAVTRKSGEYLARLPMVRGVILFIAQNSLWVYLWHILFVNLSYRFTNQRFFLKYALVYSAVTFMAYIQVMVVTRWILPLLQSETVKKNVKTILTG